MKKRIKTHVCVSQPVTAKYLDPYGNIDKEIMYAQGRKTFSLFPSRFLGLPNDSVDKKQINRKKIDLISYVQDLKDRKLSESQAIEAYTVP